MVNTQPDGPSTETPTHTWLLVTAHTQTQTGAKNAWWMVDLKDTYNISRVIIYNRDSKDKYDVMVQIKAWT